MKHPKDRAERMRVKNVKEKKRAQWQRKEKEATNGDGLSRTLDQQEAV